MRFRPSRAFSFRHRRFSAKFFHSWLFMHGATIVSVTPDQLQRVILFIATITSKAAVILMLWGLR
jgi:hypothetical protein